MSRIEGDAATVLAAVREERRSAGRGVVLVIERAGQVAPDQWSEALGSIELIDGIRAPDADIGALNQRRDVLLRSGRSVVLLAPDGGAARRILRLAPDLTAVIDAHVRVISARVRLDPGELGERVSLAQARLHATVDLTGLLPAADAVEIPLSAAYQPVPGLFQVFSTTTDPLLLLGGPGAGKTTAVRWVAGSHGAHLSTPYRRERAVVVVPLARWAAAGRDETVPLAEFLESWLGEMLTVGRLELGDDLSGWVFLLDGLDEIPSRPLRRHALDEIGSLSDRGAQVVVTGRDHVRDELLAAHHRRFRLWELGRLDRSAAAHIARAVLRTRLTESAANAALEELVAHPDYDELAASPLTVTFLAVLTLLDGRVPAHRAELYHDLVEMLVASWRRVRGGIGRTVRRGDVLRVVAPLGWALVDFGVGGLLEDDLLGVLTALETRAGAPTDEARSRAAARLDQLRSDTALLRSSEGLWRFTHPTVAEYLAAEAGLQDGGFLDALAGSVYDPKWSEVVLFALGIAIDLRPRDDVAATLLGAMDEQAYRRGRYDATIPRTVARILLEVAGISDSWRRRLAEHAARVALDRHLSQWAAWSAVDALVHLVRTDAVARLVVADWARRPGLEIHRWEQLWAARRDALGA